MAGPGPKAAIKKVAKKAVKTLGKPGVKPGTKRIPPSVAKEIAKGKKANPPYTVSYVTHWEDPFNKKPLVAGRKKREMPSKPHSIGIIRHYKKP